jgi:hypothetical protein
MITDIPDLLNLTLNVIIAEAPDHTDCDNAMVTQTCITTKSGSEVRFILLPGDPLL